MVEGKRHLLLLLSQSASGEELNKLLLSKIIVIRKSTVGIIYNHLVKMYFTLRSGIIFNL